MLRSPASHQMDHTGTVSGSGICTTLLRGDAKTGKVRYLLMDSTCAKTHSDLCHHLPDEDSAMPQMQNHRTRRLYPRGNRYD